MPGNLLHQDNLLQLPLTGEYIRYQMSRRVGEVAAATEAMVDPSVSVVIRSRNNVGQLYQLFGDISSQRYEGEVEVVVVDTESSDGSAQEAKWFGAEVVNIRQADFNYPKALNLGFAAATNKWVFSLVDHSRLLTHDNTLRIATRANSLSPEIAIIAGITLPNDNASWVEKVAAAAFFPPIVRKKAEPADKSYMGFPGSNNSLINKEAWSEVGGYDESYAAGGEDGALARAVLAANRLLMADPAMSVYHSHGANLAQSIRQFRYWANLGGPHPFDRAKLEAFNPSLA